MLKVINGGIEALVEDWPGRLGYLGKGMAPAGALDNVALRFANLVLGNEIGEACIEIAGGYFEAEFQADTVICVTGTDMKPTVNGQSIPLYEAVMVNKGDAIKFAHFGELGFRSYLGVAGGIDVPPYLGSKSTCVFGSYGGFEGRPLKAGDTVKLGKPSQSLNELEGRKIKQDALPSFTRQWDIRVVPGPQTSPDYLTEEGMDYFFKHSFKIQFASNRSAYRLDEIKEKIFAREHGGVGGGHPSNIIDNAYAMPGALNICGDTPVLLMVDGPTLGGYMNPFSVIRADMWKLGQGMPGKDTINFVNCSLEEAIQARIDQNQSFTEDLLA